MFDRRWTFARRRSQRIKALTPVITLLASLCGFATGCSHPAPIRPEVVSKDLFARRAADDQRRVAEMQSVAEKMVAHAKAEHDAFAEGKTKEHPAIDVLILSGGGDWGSFGAGVLKGWRSVKGDLALPTFDVVTGVSTGALIAPFALLGDEESAEKIVHLYRNPKPDWAESRGLFFFLPANPSFETITGLEREINHVVDAPLISRIADVGHDGRVLIVNTTNLDDGVRQAWDLTDEAARTPGKPGVQRVRQVLLASSAIPGVFPPREIDGRLYADGGVTGNILYGGDASDTSVSFSATWARHYPDLPMPTIRYWVIFNNQFRFPPQVTQPRWPAVIGRATIMGTQSATVNAIRHLSAIAELERLKHGADIQVRVMSVPPEWIPPVEGVFKPETMNALADLGEKMGADPSNWRADVKTSGGSE